MCNKPAELVVESKPIFTLFTNLPSAKEPVESAEPLIKASPPNTT